MRNDVILDSGVTNHFFGNRDMFTGKIDSYDGVLECAPGNMRIIGKWKVRIESEQSTISIHNVLFVPQLSVKLLSISKLESKGVYYALRQRKRKLNHNGGIVCDLKVSHDLLLLRLLKTTPSKRSENRAFNVHSSLGHLSCDKTKHLKLKVMSE